MSLLLSLVLAASVWSTLASADSAELAELADPAAPQGEAAGAQAATGSPVDDDAPDPLFDDLDPLDDEFDQDLALAPAHFPDPWEPSNRGALWFNGVVDRALFGPITKAYGWAVPGPVRKGVRNLIRNVNSPATIVNDALQLEWQDSGVTLTRLVINSTLGIAGIFDPADRFGLAYHDSDFGQTLAMAGVPSGPYLVLPLMGPATVRDGFGTLADALMNPLFYIWGPISFESLYLVGGVGISARDEHNASIEALREGAIDFYAALRSAYYQNRQAQIWGRREHRRPGMPEASYGPTGPAEGVAPAH